MSKTEITDTDTFTHTQFLLCLVIWLKSISIQRLRLQSVPRALLAFSYLFLLGSQLARHFNFWPIGHYL